MRRYFHRHCPEFRADEFDAWGTYELFVEVGEDGRCIRHLERYQNGFVLKYDLSHHEDQYGGIAAQAADLSDLLEFEISEAEFEDAWQAKAINLLPAGCRPDEG